MRNKPKDTFQRLMTKQFTYKEYKLNCLNALNLLNELLADGQHEFIDISIAYQNSRSQTADNY